jgi:hypothetical protein
VGLANEFGVVEREHYYHVGGQVDHRGSVTEALVHSRGLGAATPDVLTEV